MRSVRPLVPVLFGVGFSTAVMGFGALASEWGDPWGVIVLIAIAPGMPFLGNRGSSLLPAFVACAVAWTVVGALLWVGFTEIIAKRKDQGRSIDRSRAPGSGRRG
jgi:hypothetical protein